MKRPFSAKARRAGSSCSRARRTASRASSIRDGRRPRDSTAIVARRRARTAELPVAELPVAELPVAGLPAAELLETELLETELPEAGLPAAELPMARRARVAAATMCAAWAGSSERVQMAGTS